MRMELLVLAIVVGVATWAFRFVPTRLRLARGDAHGLLRRFLVATGPAAIATLFTASILPLATPDAGALVPLFLGTAAVLLAYRARPAVVLATLAGAVAYGIGAWLIA